MGGCWVIRRVVAEHRRGPPWGRVFRVSVPHANASSTAVMSSYSSVTTGGVGTGGLDHLLFLTTTTCESVST